MLKCLDKITDTSIIAADKYWANRIGILKQMSKDGNLECPWCSGKVRFRCGEVYCWHFAHCQANPNCPLSHSKPVIIDARTHLYQWLVSKYASRPERKATVTTECFLNQDYMFDCHVAFENNRCPHGYFIVSQKRQSYSQLLLYNMIPLELSANFIFLSTTAPDLSNQEYIDQNLIRLSKCHIEQICFQQNQGESTFLHFLFTDTYEIVSLFDLEHDYGNPNAYYKYATRKSWPLQEMLIQPSSGNLVHPNVVPSETASSKLKFL